MSTPLKKLLTVKDVVALWSVSKSWVYEAAAGGELPAKRLGGMLRFDPDELAAWLEKKNKAGGTVISFPTPS